METTLRITSQQEPSWQVNTILCGDALNVMRALPNASFDLLFTSPPYFHMRDYGVGQLSGEIGRETHVDQWVDKLFAVCQEAGRLLTPTGSLWLNLGDSYSAQMSDGVARKSLLQAPERLALRLTKNGWLLRNKIIWHKTNHLPSGVTDRLSCAYEYLYFFVKQPDYYFDLDIIRQAHTSKPPQRNHPTVHHHSCGNSLDNSSVQALHSLAHLKDSGRVGHPLGKNPGDVWSLAASRYRGAHRATMPGQLARLAIQAACPLQRCSRCKQPYQQNSRHLRDLALRLSKSSLDAITKEDLLTRVPFESTCDCRAKPEPGLVLDPFLGSGTTALVAAELQRNWLGIELNADYVKQAKQRLGASNN